MRIIFERWLRGDTERPSGIGHARKALGNGLTIGDSAHLSKMMRTAILALSVLSAFGQISPGSEDFHCGEEIGYLCGDLPKDEIHACLQAHRYQLFKPCHDHILEEESFNCGVELEVLCGKSRNSTAFRFCIKSHESTLERICPEMDREHFYDERSSIHCGEDAEIYCPKDCSRTGGVDACIKCLKGLTKKTQGYACASACGDLT